MPSIVAYRFLEASRTMEKQKEIKKGKASQTPLKKTSVLKKPASKNAGSKQSGVHKRPAAKSVDPSPCREDAAVFKTPDRKTKPLSEPAGTPWAFHFKQ